MKRRLLSIFLAFYLLVSYLPVEALAAGTYEEVQPASEADKKNGAASGESDFSALAVNRLVLASEAEDTAEPKAESGGNVDQANLVAD